MGLYLDAFATYRGMLAIARPDDARLPYRLYRRRARRDRRRALTVARYRRIVLLGGRDLTEQWHRRVADPQHETKRDEARRRLRHSLHESLQKEIQRIVEPTGVGWFGRAGDRWGLRGVGCPARVEWEDALPVEPRDGTSMYPMRELLALAAIRDAAWLQWRLWLRVLDRRGTTLTPAALALTRLCIRTRLRYVRWELEGKPPDSERWPPSEHDIAAEVERIEHGRLPWPRGRSRTGTSSTTRPAPTPSRWSTATSTRSPVTP